MTEQEIEKYWEMIEQVELRFRSINRYKKQILDNPSDVKVLIDAMEKQFKEAVSEIKEYCKNVEK